MQNDHTEHAVRAVEVKQLEWQPDEHGDATAQSILGTYFADANGCWSLRGGHPLTAAGALEGAKAAAQADFEQRIRSTLA
ncbi:hypothetical protein [Shinella sumterensis]|uniref:Uncharacterized protein n=1 Tax=Shinella sumterensis TaxID=1967501 RepID=A0AA50CNF1_9HYPH|nr:hypothetical protein [Shinella sumterensis]WLR98755.1 hypothetical protein Q9313_06960 [Shinella sumterensis]